LQHKNTYNHNENHIKEKYKAEEKEEGKYVHAMTISRDGLVNDI
jgi:hypothetical protein